MAIARAFMIEATVDSSGGSNARRNCKLLPQVSYGTSAAAAPHCSLQNILWPLSVTKIALIEASRYNHGGYSDQQRRKQFQMKLEVACALIKDLKLRLYWKLVVHMYNTEATWSPLRYEPYLNRVGASNWGTPTVRSTYSQGIPWQHRNRLKVLLLP